MRARFLSLFQAFFTVLHFFLRLSIGKYRFRTVDDILIVTSELRPYLFHAVKGFGCGYGTTAQVLKNIKNGLKAVRGPEYIPKAGIAEKPYLFADLGKGLFGLGKVILCGGLGLFRHFLRKLSNTSGGIHRFLRGTSVFIGKSGHHLLVFGRFGRQISHARCGSHKCDSPAASQKGNKAARRAL